MRTKTSALIALPTALLLALSLSACDEDAVNTTTDSSPSSSDDSSTSSDNESQDSKDSDDASPSSKASASSTSSSSATADPNARTVTIEDLKAGDCISDIATDTQDSQKVATEATVVDCSTPHQYEMVGTGDTTASTFSEADTNTEMSKICEPLVTSYVGSPSKANSYRILAVTPSQETWDQGDRTFVCFAQNSDKSPLNNSIKNS
jgi:hypothetical protein avisC_05188